ncbi:MAG: hypothetical protein C0622_10520 [Desulfuromonas sp.]|nr:MAG: hypothetical protein C0622_10520 [Desulfuromonas sp.]
MHHLKLFIFLFVLFIYGAEYAQAGIDSVVVSKATRTMYLVKDGTPIKEYHIALGGNPQGHKQQEGDERTPEGMYLLDSKNSDSDFHKAIHISYPNAQDRARAKEMGVSPGGAIMIHGQKNGFGWLAGVTQRFDWTAGCIAVTNSDMNEIWDLIEPGTPIEIRP